MLARVLIRPKSGVVDPQGKAVERALPSLGFEGVGAGLERRYASTDSENAREKIEQELAYLQIAVEKTAGPCEHDAWRILVEKIEDFYKHAPAG